MKIFERMTRIVFGIIGAALMVLACGLILYAGVQVLAVFDAPEASIGVTMLDSIGYMVIAIAVFEVAKYILEEEVFNPTENRHAGEARRSITKFVSTIIIADLPRSAGGDLPGKQEPGDARPDALSDHPAFRRRGADRRSGRLSAAQRLSRAGDQKLARSGRGREGGAGIESSIGRHPRA